MRLCALTEMYDSSQQEDVFKEIVELLRPRLNAFYTNHAGWSGNQHQDEVVARVLVLLHTKFVDFQPRGTYTPYKYACVLLRKQLRDIIKREQVRPRYSLEGLRERYPHRRDICIESDGPEDILMKEEEAAIRRDAVVDCVPSYCRPMLTLLQAGFSGAVIRAKLGMSKRLWIEYAYQIRKALKEYDEYKNRPAHPGAVGDGGR